MSRRWVRWTAVVGVVVAAAPLGRWALRQLSFFQVRQVELVGLRYLAPDRVLAALALAPGQNLFDPLGPIERRAEGLAGVVRARAGRKLPGTLRVVIVERPAIAFAPGAEQLVPLDAVGRPLPYDPAATGLDLPVVQRADPVLLETLARVRAVDSTLYQEVDAAARQPNGAVMLELGPRRVFVPARPTNEEIRAVAVVRRHLAATGRSYTELDARYAGWLIARRGLP